MTPQDPNNVMMIISDEHQFGDHSMRGCAMLEELSFVRREAQAEANAAYEDWRDQPSRDRYAVYLAAQDRADTAQDQLAHWTHQLAAN